MNGEYEEEVVVFKAFCDEKRLHILALLRGGEKCACKLLENLELGQSSLSYHMKILVESGVVESRQEGKWTYYNISVAGSTRAKEMLNAITTVNVGTEDNICIKK